MQLPSLEDDRYDLGGPRPGLTWWLESWGGTKLVTHSGGANGQPAFLCIVPDRRFALGVLTNNEQTGGTLARRLKRWVLERYLGIVAEIPHPNASVFDFEEAEGVYENEDFRFHVQRDGDMLRVNIETLRDWLAGADPHLVETTNPELLLYPVAPDIAVPDPVSDIPPQCEFLRDRDGRVSWFRYSRRANPRLS